MAVGRPIKLTPNVARKTVSITATADQTTFTPTGGFVSAASTSACKITFSGQTLTFTVAGVGATSLTLY